MIEQKKKMKRTAFATVIKKKPTTSIKKHANELKVHEKTFRTAIKQDLRPELNPLDYAKRGVLENKTNVTSHRIISLLKTASEDEWNKMSEEFILKACKSFRRRVDAITKKKKKKTNKNDSHIERTYCLEPIFLCCCLSFKIKINIIYSRTTPLKTPTIRPPASHHENYPN